MRDRTKVAIAKRCIFLWSLTFVLNIFLYFQRLVKYGQKSEIRPPFSKMAAVAQHARVLIFYMLLLGTSTTHMQSISF